MKSNGTMAVLLAGAATLQPAQARLDDRITRLYGGVYSNACTDSGALRVRFFDNTMVVERGGRIVSGSNVRAHKGNPDPKLEGFQTSILGEVPGGDGFILVVYRSPQGLFTKIEGGAQTLSALGPDVQGQHLRHCDPNRNVLAGAKPAAPAFPASPPDLLRDPKFKAAYLQALGPLARERWLQRLDGPAPQNRQVKIDGVQYVLAAACKPHDCADHNMIVLHDPRKGKVLGVVQQNGHRTLLGDPDKDTARDLEKLWAKEWKSKS